MRIKRMKVTASDTTKSEYVVKVRNLLAQHDHKGQQAYLNRARELFENQSDSETMLPIILSA